MLKDKTKLAESGGSICEACENFTKYRKFSLKLRPDTRQAVNALLQGSDVLVVLLTGFGKSSMIIQPFVSMAAIERNQHQTVLSVCPLQSIIDEQIAEARSMGLSAASIADGPD